MQRGRKPKPAALKKLAGNPGHRKPIGGAPATPGRPPMPRDLGPVAAAEWQRVVEMLEQMKLLGVQDGPAIRIYCDAYARYVAAAEKLSEDGMLFVTEKGYPIQSPYLGIQSTAVKQMQTFFSEFGFTPSSRMRVKPLEKEDPDDFSAFVNAK